VHCWHGGAREVREPPDKDAGGGGMTCDGGREEGGSPMALSWDQGVPGRSRSLITSSLQTPRGGCFCGDVGVGGRAAHRSALSWDTGVRKKRTEVKGNSDKDTRVGRGGGGCV